MTNQPRTAPVLASFGWKDRVSMVATVEGGLSYLRGNSSPHFSLTMSGHLKGFPDQCQCGGADHDTILKHFPQFADLADLHLSDMNGSPMHAEANGWYNLAGALGGMGERFTVLNSKRHFPLPVIDPKEPWRTTEYRFPTRAEALEIFAQHIRAPLEVAQAIAELVAAESTPALSRDVWRAEVEKMRPRWAEEAAACIAKHSLVVFGDDWKGV